jgi:hypothetical protein
VIETECGEEVLETQSPGGRLTAASLVAIDDRDAVAWPAEGDSEVGQRLLSCRRFLVSAHLLGTRLTDVDDGFAVQMAIADLGGA